MIVSEQDLGYATDREKSLVALALRLAAGDAKEQVTVQSRTEEYGRNQTVEKINELAAGYEAQASGPGLIPWSDLSETEQLYWVHEAAAVQRAVERGGFREKGSADGGLAAWMYQRFGNRL